MVRQFEKESAALVEEADAANQAEAARMAEKGDAAEKAVSHLHRPLHSFKTIRSPRCDFNISYTARIFAPRHTPDPSSNRNQPEARSSRQNKSTNNRQPPTRASYHFRSLAVRAAHS